MLIQDFVEVNASYPRVCCRFLEKEPRWLADGATAAYADGERLVASMSATDDTALIGRRVHVSLGAAYARGDGSVMPLSWWAASPRRLFPTLDADLEIMPMGPDQVMLKLMGRYQPPLGVIGRGLDRLILHRIAEACVRSFLRRTAISLEKEQPA